ncbi:MAG: hypothetical protein V8S24_16280 [Gordonibacter pamelaeae]
MTLLALGEVFVCVKRFYSLNERIGVEMFRARKSVYRLYDSYATFDRTGGGDEGAGRSGSGPDCRRTAGRRSRRCPCTRYRSACYRHRIRQGRFAPFGKVCYRWGWRSRKMMW